MHALYDQISAKHLILSSNWQEVSIIQVMDWDQTDYLKAITGINDDQDLLINYTLDFSIEAMPLGCSLGAQN